MRRWHCRVYGARVIFSSGMCPAVVSFLVVCVWPCPNQVGRPSDPAKHRMDDSGSGTTNSPTQARSRQEISRQLVVSSGWVEANGIQNQRHEYPQSATVRHGRVQPTHHGVNSLRQKGWSSWQAPRQFAVDKRWSPMQRSRVQRSAPQSSAMQPSPAGGMRWHRDVAESDRTLRRH